MRRGELRVDPRLHPGDHRTPHDKQHESPLGYDPNDRGRQAQPHFSAPTPIYRKRMQNGISTKASPRSHKRNLHIGDFVL